MEQAETIRPAFSCLVHTRNGEEKIFVHQTINAWSEFKETTDRNAIAGLSDGTTSRPVG